MLENEEKRRKAKEESLVQLEANEVAERLQKLVTDENIDFSTNAVQQDSYGNIRVEATATRFRPTGNEKMPAEVLKKVKVSAMAGDYETGQLRALELAQALLGVK